uniref:Uncharacterized protein n=1 Tax=Salarias fasciatus TaxID=181472 RepID=A0A672GVM6_SALFA
WKATAVLFTSSSCASLVNFLTESNPERGAALALSLALSFSQLPTKCDCCCVSALQCYRDSMKVHLNVTESKQKKLYNSLKHSYTIRSLNFCNSGNTTTVPACDSYPKEKARDFFKRLESLIQRVKPFSTFLISKHVFSPRLHAADGIKALFLLL